MKYRIKQRLKDKITTYTVTENIHGLFHPKEHLKDEHFEDLKTFFNFDEAASYIQRLKKGILGI